MQKFYSQMTENEVRDRMLNKTLGVLEGEVQRLTARANELDSENLALREETEGQRQEIEVLREQVRKATEAVTQERWTYAKELEEFAKQLSSLKARITRVPEAKSPRTVPRKNANYLLQISELRNQLDTLSSSLMSPRAHVSPKRNGASPSRRLKAASPRATSPMRLQSEVEEMISRIEARLQRARELTQSRE